MATHTVTTTSYVSLPDGASDQDAEAVVREALSTAKPVYLVKVERERILLSK